MVNGSVSCYASKNECGYYVIHATLPSGEEREYGYLLSDGEEAEKLCNLVNRMSVSERHIDDIIDDFVERLGL